MHGETVKKIHFFDNNVKYKNSLCGKNATALSVNPDGTHSWQSDLNVKKIWSTTFTNLGLSEMLVLPCHTARSYIP